MERDHEFLNETIIAEKYKNKSKYMCQNTRYLSNFYDLTFNQRKQTNKEYSVSFEIMNKRSKNREKIIRRSIKAAEGVRKALGKPLCTGQEAHKG